MSCFNLPEASLERSLCLQIAGEIGAASDFIRFDLGNQLNGVKNTVTSAQNNIIGNIIQGLQITTNNISSAANQVRNQLTAESESIRANIWNQTSIINDRFNSQTNLIANVNQWVTDQIKSSIASSQARNLAELDQAENDIRRDLAVSASNAIAEFNRVTEPIRQGVSDLQSQIETTVGGITAGIEDEITRIWNELKARLAALFDPLFAYIDLKIQEFLSGWDAFWGKKGMELELTAEQLRNMVLGVLNGDFSLVQELLNFINNPNNQRSGIQVIVFILILIPNIYSFANALGRPYAERLEQEVNKLVSPSLLQEAELIRGFWTGRIEPAEIVSQLALQGYNPQNIQRLIEVSKQIIGVSELREMYYRGLIPEGELDLRLSMLAYGDNDIDLIKSIFPVIPPIQDMVRFAVREVYSPEIYQKFGLGEDLPKVFLSEASKHGLSEKEATNYWAAHWELPGTIDGFNMFHRELINQDELELLLRAKDVMPFWRDKLIGLSYDLPTRVDIRRMFHVGEISLDEVYQFYRHSGYDDRTAKALTKFTEIEYSPEDTNGETSIRLLARTSIEKAYVRGLISRDEAVAMMAELQYTEESAELLLDLAEFSKTVDSFEDLKDDFDRRIRNFVIKLYTYRTISRDDAVSQLLDLNFTEDEANQLLDIADLEYSLSIQDEILDNVRKQYIARTVSRDQLVELLSAFGFTSEELTRALEGLDIFRELRDRKPSFTQFTNFLKDGIITIDQYVDELKGLGYADKYIDMYVTQLIVKGSILLDEGIE